MKRFLPLFVATIFLTSHFFVLAQDLDLIIRGGSLIDGSGSPAAKADIGIKDDRIVFVGSSADKKPGVKSTQLTSSSRQASSIPTPTQRGTSPTPNETTTKRI